MVNKDHDFLDLTGYLIDALTPYYSINNHNEKIIPRLTFNEIKKLLNRYLKEKRQKRLQKNQIEKKILNYLLHGKEPIIQNKDGAYFLSKENIEIRKHLNHKSQRLSANDILRDRIIGSLIALSLATFHTELYLLKGKELDYHKEAIDLSKNYLQKLLQKVSNLPEHESEEILENINSEIHKFFSSIPLYSDYDFTISTDNAPTSTSPSQAVAPQD